MAKEKTGAIFDKDGKPYNYVVIIDAGSSGSRLHVYSYPDTRYKAAELIRRHGDDDEDDTDDDDKDKDDEDGEDEDKHESSKGDKGNDDNNDDKDNKAVEEAKHQESNHESEHTSSDSKLSLPVISKQGNKWAKKIKPGISTFSEQPDQVGKKHLKKLLKYAEKVVPYSQHSRTPIFLHATGGMRILTEKARDKILKNTCDYIKDKTKFYIPDCATHINVITGDVEGIFGWLAVNYMVGGLQNPENHDHGKGHTTYGLLEMGGASTQITFVPNATEIEEHNKDLYNVKLANLSEDKDADFKVSSTTFLGLGVNEVQKKVLDQLGDAKENPCDPAGLEVKYDKDGRRILGDGDKDKDDDDSDDEEVRKVATKTTGSGNFTECQNLMKPLVTGMKDAIGADFDFDINHFIGVSEYWDTAHDGFQMGGKFDSAKLETKVKEFCETSWLDLQKQHKNNYKDLSLEQLESLCIRASWILNMVDNGLMIPKASDLPAGDGAEHDETLDHYLHPLQSVEQINGNKYSWTLGRAILYASAEQGLNGVNGTGIVLKSSDTNAGPLLYGSETGRPVFNPKDANQKNPNNDNDDDDGYDWDDLLEHHSKRLWGSLLFLLILVVILYLLLGKVRRNIIWQSIKTRIQSFRGDGSRVGGNKYTPMRREQEEGADELELGTIEQEGADQFSINSDDEAEGANRRTF